MSAAQRVFVRPLRAPEAAAASDPHLAHAFGTDPEGAFAAAGAEGAMQGLAAGVVRGDVLQLVRLSVEPAARGKGLGRALLNTVRAYGRARGARALEVLAPSDPAALGFLFSAGLPLRTLALKLERRASPSAAAPPTVLTPVGEGALSGWVADLDRETRSFPRAPEWRRWRSRRGAEMLALLRRQRPEALGLILPAPEGLLIGPIEARSPEAAADLLPLLVARVRVGAGVRLLLPAEARVLLGTAKSLGFTLVETSPFFGRGTRGDFRRYAASSTPFF